VTERHRDEQRSGAPATETGGDGLNQVLGPFDATMIVMGCIIGAGIFRTPRDVAAAVDSMSGALGLWLLGGVIALTGAFVFAELGALLPRAGGQYVFLRETMGRVLAFFYGWLLLAAITSSAMAYVSLVFVDHLQKVFLAIDPGWELSGWLHRGLAIALVLSLTVVNIRGIRLGATVQNIAMLAKIAGLLLVVSLGVFAWLQPPTEEGLTATVETPSAAVGGLGVALLSIVFSYGGFQNVSAAASEVRRPERTVPFSILIGTAAVILLYLGLNAALFVILGRDKIASSATPVADAAQAVFPGGGLIVSMLVVVSTAAIIQALLMVTPRIYFAMARDGVFLAAAARVHPQYRTPAVAIGLQCTCVILHLFFGRHLDLLHGTVLVDWTFFSLCGVALFVLRIRRPDQPRPYRVPLYPWTPALFLLLSVAVVVDGLLKAEPAALWRTAAIVAIGFVLFVWWRQSTQGRTPPSTVP
jgi:APA family basic amino acid/polyamine antiporter